MQILKTLWQQQQQMYLNQCQMLIKYTTAESSLTNTKSNKVPHQVGNLCCQKLFLSTCNVIRSKVIETFSNLNKGLISRKPQNFIKYR